MSSVLPGSSASSTRRSRLAKCVPRWSEMQCARRAERRREHELARGGSRVEYIEGERLARDSNHADPRIARHPRHYREDPRHRVRVPVAVEMRHRDPRPAHALDLRARLRLELPRIHAPEHRAPRERAERVELCLLYTSDAADEED